MEEYTIKKLKKLKHLSDYSVIEIISSLGLYEPVIIDPSDIITKESGGGSGHKILLLPGADVQMLYLLLRSEEALMLPCAYCKKEQPFKGEDTISPFIEEPCYTVYKDAQSCEVGVLGSYFDSNLVQMGINPSQYHEQQVNDAKNVNRQRVLDFLTYGYNTYTCQLNSRHKIQVSYILEEIDLTDELNEDNLEEYAKFKNCIILKKIGQYPSIADMQFFECIKYKKVLKNSYRDYTMALGLFASGVGAGAFLYLRRVLEKLVEEAHQACISNEIWDEQLYKGSHFDDKIKLVESAGEIIIPAELNPIRNRIYGVLSKGVHESDEDECKELFPYIKLAIDLILDTKIAAKERTERIKKLQETLQ